MIINKSQPTFLSTLMYILTFRIDLLKISHKYSTFYILILILYKIFKYFNNTNVKYKNIYIHQWN